MTHPYFCYTHNGLYAYEDGKNGCQHPDCIALRSIEIDGRIVAGVGETHSEYWKKEQHRKFNEDMSSYREARRNGLQPEMVSKQAVEKAEKRAYLEEKLARRVE